MTIELSQEFKDFMIALKTWVDEGCPEPTEDQRRLFMGFRKNDSICFQIVRWTEDDEAIKQIDDDLQHLFKKQFEQADLPFNKLDGEFCNSAEYDAEIENGTHYQNPARLKWINDTVASFGEKADEPE